ncbi:hypothetical protein F8M41_004873 [Gigaspora margarita]|uniref:Uncharacterized protein n=1 Tax=Gigaspora margarita TaxID=4874 RepID=A0A8H4A6K8_GIGMA|nr:hypothetical protein F8M41_004873 [Gigaspora margarita]
MIAILIGRNDSTAQSITLLWLSQSSISGYIRANRQPQGTALKTPKKGCSTLSNMGLTSVSQNQTCSTALETNPIPNMSTYQTSQTQTPQTPQTSQTSQISQTSQNPGDKGSQN